jgi:hypothetical protein
MPATEIGRRITVITNRNPQDKQRHHIRRDVYPRPVIPGALVPTVIPENPVNPIVKEVVGSHTGSVIDGIPWNPNQ